MTFANKVCVITGAASGIGRALALELARRGAHLALVDWDETGLADTAEQCSRRGVKVTSERLDVSDKQGFFAFADRTLEAHGRVDAVINNAGVTVSQTLVEQSLEDWEWIFGINFWGVLYGTKAFLPHMLERDSGWIVNISSVFGFFGVPTQSSYNATKFAVRGMTEDLRQELADTGVSVSCVHPGGIQTDIVKNARFYVDTEGGDNHQVANAEFAKLARTSPEQAAKIILRGMEDREPRILVGPDAKLIDVVIRSVPVSYPRLFRFIRDRVVRRS
jgi:NAD(P)-dependent dehydrogenase (short-subunit alcohol dehydrogenase family)